MRLKRLELYGYKSFATRCVFEFGQGITAIVGPNGSGKSNVADAVRWVMGEQSYRSMRAKTSADMIFAGSRGRSRLGIAEVMVTLDNSDGSIPVDYTEVTVGRRAFRSGENEYLLNGNRVRRRDIVELLSGAGLARSSYTVIGQGMVDQALALTPEARRALFEEAAGITPHLMKRDEALSRIQETERNLERVQDILGELHPQARRLRRQAERAEEHQLLAQDLQELQRIWYGYQWQRSQHLLLESDSALQDAQARVAAHKQYAQGFVARLDGLRRAAEQHQDQLRTLDRARDALRGQIQDLKHRTAVVAERQRLYQQQQHMLAHELEALAARRDILQREVAATTAELAEQQQMLNAGQVALEAARSQQTVSDQARRALTEQAQQAQKGLNRLVQNQARLQARLDQNARQRAAFDDERAKSETLLAQAEQRMAEGERHKDAMESQAQTLAQQAAVCTAEHDAMVAQIDAMRQELQESQAELRRLQNHHDQLASRHDMLTRVRQELTGLLPGVRAVVSAKQRLGGILGTVVNLMKVPQDYEAAIESALGGRLQNIVTATWDDAERAIAHLKSTQSGWATFLPLDTVRSRSPLKPPNDADIVGVASELVDYEPRLRPVFEMLLGGILIVRDLPAARRLLHARTGATLLVTLGGETVQPSGALSGGNRSQRTNLLEQEREWRQLPSLMAEIKSQGQELADTVKAHQQRLSETEAQAKSHQTRLATLEREQQANTAALNRAQSDQREQQREQAWLAERRQRIERDLTALAEDDKRLNDELAAAQAEELEISTTLSAAQQRLAESDDAALRQHVAELETSSAVAQRTVTSQQRLIASHQDNLAQIATQMQEKNAQIASLAADLRALADSAEQEQARQTLLAAQLRDMDEQEKPVRLRLRETEQARAELEHQQTQSTSRLHEAELELNRAMMARERAQDQQNALAQEVAADLGPIALPDTVSHQLRLTLGDDSIELPTVSAMPSGLGEEIRHLKARIGRLGNINLDAPREYEEVIERETFLETQGADLRGAIAALHEIIQELEEVIERDFGATVERVDQAFGVYFSRLFDGGSARILLTDPEHLSETGVDIIAHPPGKRAQALSLLSGGERALTAVALIFALLVANPVPFCFLDEVDAALDEANVGRFRDLLAEQAATIQFAVITHNRRTIEAATTIFGVSMGEVGVSQSVSLKLENVGTYTSGGSSAAASM